MKKNRFIKIAAAVFTLCLITTCGISTTLAKYTTGGNAQDSARVAKWGVQLTMEGDPLFHNVYATDDTVNYDGALSVKSIDDAQVVAPGTASAVAGSSARFAITGQPEVAVQIDITFNFVDIYLKAAEDLRDHTKAAVENGNVSSYETFDLAADYHPVVFTLKQTKAAGADVNYVIVDAGTLADVQAAIEAFSGAQYAPNTNIGAEFELSWAWAFEPNDQADTYLGQLAAGINVDSLTEVTDYSLDISYELEIHVTQID